MAPEFLGLVASGLLAGTIDAIAGGGGLITLPALIVIMGHGVPAIATNKMAGVSAALMAFLVYLSKGHFNWRKSLLFAFWVAFGSLVGSKMAGWFPRPVFVWTLWITSPLLLWIILRKDLWMEQHEPVEAEKVPERKRTGDYFSSPLIVCGLLSGFYDGIWGPGGGTLMFLSLFLVAKQPLLAAIATGRFANLISASTALSSYASQGMVDWKLGVPLALGIGVGAWFGAHQASKLGHRIVRPVLAVAVLLLLGRLAWGQLAN